MANDSCKKIVIGKQFFTNLQDILLAWNLELGEVISHATSVLLEFNHSKHLAVNIYLY